MITSFFLSFFLSFLFWLVCYKYTFHEETTLALALTCAASTGYMEKHPFLWSIYPIQGRRKHFTFGQAGFSGEGESVEMRANRVR